ncbi:MAG TPA: carboxypeptidase-like regulatory domain-containing protein [Gemmataceae bacterium]|jgi:hypothetical protein|nr:carboxypeptidase-like regulatory domain-containing protein [Gemmataceae bacterium]
MCVLRRVTITLLLTLLLLSNFGCGLSTPFLSQGSWTSVTVRDAETDQPIPSAQVRVWHFNQTSSANSNHTVATDRSGKAQLQGLSGKTDDLVLEVAAKGYATEEKSIDPAGQISILLYAEPNPTIELTVPGLYRGLVSVRVQIRDNQKTAPGERVFSFEIPESGVVEVAAPALFQHMSPDFRAKYADGAALPDRPQGPEVGLWWLKTSGEYEVFLIGTKGDYEAYWREHANEQPNDRKGGRGHGGGKGGHGGHGRGGSPGNSPGGAGTAGPSADTGSVIQGP